MLRGVQTREPLRGSNQSQITADQGIWAVERQDKEP